jgi:hypothetical protein
MPKCKLCRNAAEMSYEVQRDKPIPLCGKCFGSWAPPELNSLLGITPDDEPTIPCNAAPPAAS